jgi:hypothetical protein
MSYYSGVYIEGIYLKSTGDKCEVVKGGFVDS